MKLNKSYYISLLAILCIGLATPAIAEPFDSSSRYFPDYTHTTQSGTPSITTRGETMIYFRQGGKIYRIVPMSGGRYWFGYAWPQLTDRIEESHASSIIDIPANANPITVIINGKRVSFQSFSELGRFRGQIQPVSGGGSSTSSSSGADEEGQDTTPVSSGGHGGSVPLCQLQGTCGGSSSSGGASSGGSSSGGGSSGSGGGTASSSGGPVNIPPAPAECGGATAAATVNPGNFNSALATLGGGKTLVMAPGRYPAINLSGKSYGGATLKCATPGACQTSKAILSKVSGLTIDGIKVVGGGIGIEIAKSNDVTIRCSTLVEQTSSGIVLMPGGGNTQIKIDNNVFHNDKKGCNINNKSSCQTEVGGFPVANMDYGVRVYDAASVFIRNNIFGSLSNHWISLKWGTGYALIDKNRFNACGRICIQLGQEPNTAQRGYRSVKQAVVTNNTLTGYAARGIYIQNIEKATITNNTIGVTGRAMDVEAQYKNCKPSTGGCPLLGNGFPANRQVIQQNNTIR